MAAGIGRLCLRLVIFVAVILHSASSLYEDQIGKFDWRHQYVGRVRQAVFDTTSSKSKQLIVSTDANALAALNIATGQIVWRRLLESDNEVNSIQLLHAVVDGGTDLITASRSHVRRWTSQGGFLLWEQALPSPAPQQTATHSFSAAVHDQKIVVIDLPSVRVLDLKTGTEAQSYTLPLHRDSVTAGEHGLYQSSDGDSVYVVTVVPGQYVQVHTVKDELLSSTPRTIPSTWLTDADKCIAVGASFTCYDPRSLTLKSLGLQQSSASFTAEVPALSSSGTPIRRLRQVSSSHIVVEAGHAATTASSVYEILADGSGLRHVLDVPGCVAIADGSEENDILLALIEGGSTQPPIVIGYSLKSGKELADHRQELAAPTRSPVSEMFANFLRKRDGSASFRLVVVFADHTLTLFQSTGDATWTREEALANVVAAEMVDLPVSSIQAKMEEEFGQASEGNPLSAFVRRVATQLSQLAVYVARESSRAWVHVPALLRDLGSGEQQRKAQQKQVDKQSMRAANLDLDDDEYLTRDAFNTHKTIVVASSVGKLFGLDSATGRPLWSWSLPSAVRPLAGGHYGLYLQRTTSHVPLRPVCTVVGKHAASGNAYAASFDPITGLREQDGSDLGYRLRQLTAVPDLDKDFLRPLVLLDVSGKVHFYPNSHFAIATMKSLFLYTADVESGFLNGYFIRDLHAQNPSADETWAIRIGSANERIVAVAMKKANERVHSLGKVLANRNVLYKYVNPNLIAVASEGEDKKSKFVNIYLIDGVSGKIIFHCEHKRTSGPIHMVHSENWVVYTYNNEKSHREEVAVLELFEGDTQSNATAFSSFAVGDIKPVVMRQAYVLGVPSTAALAVTITEKGITNQNVLLARKTGWVFEVPKMLLDPRRPMEPTAESREEGLPPYMPELQLSFESAINYNQSVYGVTSVYTSPAGLESTCLVLVCGLDLFFTTVAPSRMYDVLKDDFDFFFISSVTIAMIVVSVVSKRLAVKRAIQKAWK